MTTLYLATSAPIRLRHRPTERRGMQFTPDNRWALYEWLAADLGRDRFEMTDSQLAIQTTQGDQVRDIGVGGWALERLTRSGEPEFYPVDAEVVEDEFDKLGPA